MCNINDSQLFEYEYFTEITAVNFKNVYQRPIKNMEMLI